MDLIAEYRHYRESMRRLHSDIIKTTVERADYQVAAKALGMWVRGTLVFDNESEMDILSEFMIHEKHPGRTPVLERYSKTATLSDEAERVLLAALLVSPTSLYAILDVDPVGHVVQMADILWDRDDVNVVDIAMSRTATPGGFLFGRLIRLSRFAMTSGVSFPFRAEDGQYLLQRYEKMPKSNHNPPIESRNRFLLFYNLSRKYGIETRYE